MSQTYFMHIRNLDQDGNISNYGGTTIAYREVTGGVEFAESWCSVRDNFNKALGRVKAAGRLNSDHYRQFFKGDFIKFRQEIVKENVL